MSLATNLPQSLINSLKSLTCQHCHRSFYKDNLQCLSLPCTHTTCRECSARKCKQCKDFDLNREHIDYALVGVLEGAKEVELGEKEVEPKNLKGLLYLFIAWLVIIAGLTIATIVASHLHKSHQVKYIADAKACLNQNGSVTTIGWSFQSLLQKLLPSPPIIPTYPFAPILSVGRFHIHIKPPHLNNLFNHFKDQLKKLKSVTFKGLNLGGKVLSSLSKTVFHSVQQAVVDVSQNAIGDLGMMLLPEISESIVSLDMAENLITDVGLKYLSGKFPVALETLGLSQNAITSAGVCGLGQSLNGFVSKAAKHLIKLDSNPIKQEFADLVKNGKKQFACVVGTLANNAFCNFTINLGEFGDILVKDLFHCT